MDARSVVSGLIQALRRSAEPAKLAFQNEEAAVAFLREFGWDAPVAASDLQDIRDRWGFEAVFNTLSTLGATLESGAPDEVQIIADSLASIAQLGNMLQTVNAPGPGVPFPFDQPAFWNEVPRALVDRLTFDGLMRELPLLGAALFAVGILDRATVTPSGAGRIPYTRYSVQWERLGDLLSRPGTFIQNAYQWGSTPFRHDRLLDAVEILFKSLNFAPRREEPLPDVADAYYAPGNPALPALRVLKIPLVFQVVGAFDDWLEIGIQMMPITPAGQTSQPPNGFFVAPLARGAVTAEILPETSPVSLSFTGGFETDAAFRLEVRPTGVDLVPSSPGATTITAQLALSGRPEEPYILIGSPRSHRVELEGFRVAIGVRGPLDDPEFIFEAGTGTGLSAPRLRFILQASEGDGFIRTLLGDNPVSLDLALMITWSSKAGLGISGNVGFTVEIPIHKEFGPVRLESIKIAAGVDLSGQARIGVGINAGAKLGPLAVVVENIGAKVLLVTAGPGRPPVFGNLALDWKFQPPNGLGISIDAAAFRGGGFISFDPDAGRYAGMLELTFSGTISLKAFGVLNTKLPDGRPGFSLLLFIFAEFTAIQLGYGFTLNGVGGMIGINRTLRLDALREGVYTGALNSILFPNDIVANAVRIFSDSERILPIAPDRFVFGPMAKIGWGTPTLVTLELGLIIELPSPLRIALVGVLKCVLPDESVDILRIQVNFMGALDMEAKMLSFDASLFNSRLLVFTLTGGMAVRLKWGDDPNFLLTVGGFHPSFQPPPLALPRLSRLGISLLEGDNPRLALECYFAVTSNTVQFGARIELRADAGPFYVYGFLGFDALFQFSPFYFVVSVGAMLEVRAGSATLFCVSLELELSGPTPWHAKGTASFRILFVKIKVRFSTTWGDERDTSLPDERVMPLLLDALRNRGNWQARLPPGNTLSVTVREIPATGDQLVAHPAGTLSVVQKVVPFDVPIQKFGAKKPADARLFRIESAASGAVAFNTGTLREEFAPAQFFEMDNAAKLARKSFEKMPAGVELRASASAWSSSRIIRRAVTYERIIIDTLYRRFQPVRAALRTTLFDVLLGGNAAALSAKGSASKSGAGAASNAARVEQESFVVVSTATLSAFDSRSRWASETEARAYHDALVRGGAAPADIQVVPSFEAATR